MQSLSRYSVSGYNRPDLKVYTNTKFKSADDGKNSDLKNMLLLLTVLAGLFLTFVLYLPQISSLN